MAQLGMGWPHAMPTHEHNEEFLNAAHDYRGELNWPIFPLKPGEKVPAGKWAPQGFKDATLDPERVEKWWTHTSAGGKPFNIGVSTGPARLLVVDVDPRHGGDTSFTALYESEGLEWLETTTTHTPSGGLHLYFTLPDGVHIPSKTNALGSHLPGIDVRADGGYIVAPPSQLLVDGEVKEYRWAPQRDPWTTPPLEAPQWLIEQLTTPPPAPGPSTTHQKVDLREAWDVGLSEGSRNESLFKIAAKMRGTGLPWEAAEQAILSYADRAHPPLPHEEALAVLMSAYRRYPAGNPAIFQSGAFEPPAPTALRLVPLADLRHKKPPAWLISGLLTESSLAVLVSKPAGGKTFTALAMGLAIATGTPFLGREVQQGPVVYMVGEGLAGFYRRSQAWLAQQQLAEDPADFLVIEEPVQLRNRDVVEMLQDALGALAQPPKLLVIDTLARSLVGGDENSARDVGEWIAGAEYITRTVGCTVLLLHHTGKADGANYRGSSALEGAADTMMSLSGAADALELKCDKQKDAERFAPIHLKLAPAGDSMVLAIRGESDGLTRAEREALYVLSDFDTPVPFSKWFSGIREGGVDLKTEYAVRVAIKRLLAAGLVVVEGDGHTTRYTVTQRAANA